MNYVVNPLSTPLPQIGAVPAIQFDLVNTRSNLGIPQDRCDNNCGCGDSTSCGCTAAARDCECSSSTMNGPFAKAKEWVEEQVEKVKEKVGDATEKAEKAKEDAKEAITGVFEDAGKVVGDGDSKFGNWWQEHTDGEWGDKWANRLTGVYDSFTDGETPWLDEHTDGEFREQFGAWWQEHTDGEWGDKWAGKLTGVYDNLTNGEPANWRNPVGDKVGTSFRTVCRDSWPHLTFDDLGTTGDCGSRTCSSPKIQPGWESPWMTDATETELLDAGWRLPRIVGGPQELRDLVARGFVLGVVNSDVVEWVACKVTKRNGATYQCMKSLFSGKLPTIRLIPMLDQPHKPGQPWTTATAPGATGGGGQIYFSYDHARFTNFLAAASSSSAPKRFCATIAMACHIMHEAGHASCVIADESSGGPTAHEKDCSKPNRAATPYFGWALSLRYWPWVCQCCGPDLLNSREAQTLGQSTFDFWRYRGTWYPGQIGWGTC